jgi:predicted membrane-bound spermidine synthase
MFPRKSDNQGNTIVLYKPYIRATARALTAALAIALLLAPIIALNSVQQIVVRFIIIFAAATCFVVVITVASKASMAEIFAAGAAYSAVLVVFVSGNGLQTQTQK